MNRAKTNYEMVLTAAFMAIIIMMTIIPFLGYIPLGFMNATIIHVPVIIGAIILRSKKGAFLGFIFGCSSLWKNTFMPNPTSFVFSPFVVVGSFHGNIWSLAVCFLPRILMGVITYYSYRFLTAHLGLRKKTTFFLAGMIGSLTNTLLVMNLIYLCFANQYAMARDWVSGSVYGSIMGIILTTGIPEALIAGFMTSLITPVLMEVNQ